MRTEFYKIFVSPLKLTRLTPAGYGPGSLNMSSERGRHTFYEMTCCFYFCVIFARRNLVYFVLAGDNLPLRISFY